MPTHTLDEIVDAIVTFVNTEIMAPGHTIGSTDCFEAVGVDSLALLKMLLFVEREFGFFLPDEDLVDGNVATATALGQYVALHLERG